MVFADRPILAEVVPGLGRPFTFTTVMVELSIIFVIIFYFTMNLLCRYITSYLFTVILQSSKQSIGY
jgi:phage shock protein PspC (stress-responsive transcriptional regulator)